MQTISINNFFDYGNNTEQIHIPLFQRKYSWDKFQVSQFLGDFEKALNSDEKHFFGLIVFVPRKNLDPSLVGIDVIDGQQRLTTTIILLSVLKDMLWDLTVNYDSVMSPKEKLDINMEFSKILQILQKNRGHGSTECKLITENEEKFEKEFLEIIQKSFNCYTDQSQEPRKSYQELQLKDARSIKKEYMLSRGNKNTTKSKNSLKNYEEIWDWFLLELKTDDTYMLKFNKLKRCSEIILYNFEIIPFEVKSYQKAFEYFEVLNDRGLDVSALDLIKNVLLKTGSDNKERLKIFEDWKNIFVDVLKGVSNKTQFVRYSYMSKNGHISTKKIYTSFQKYFSEPNFNIDNFLNKELSLHAEIYSDFYNSIKLKEKNGHHNIGNAIELLKSTKTIQWQSVAIAVLEPFYLLQDSPTYDDGLINKAITVLKLLHEIMMSVNFIGTASANDIEKPFPNEFARALNYDIYNPNQNEALDKFKSELDTVVTKLNSMINSKGWGWEKIIDSLQDKNNFISFFKDRNSMGYMLIFVVYYQSSNTDLTQHLLEQRSLEHVFPENPKEDEWDILSHLTANEKDMLCYSYGNFMIATTSWNSKYNNLGWLKKKGKYFDSDLNELLSAPFGWKTSNDWDQETVDQREEKIIELITEYSSQID